MWNDTRWGDCRERTSLHTGIGGGSGKKIRTRGGERSEPSVCPRIFVPEPPLSLCVCQIVLWVDIFANPVFRAVYLVGTYFRGHLISRKQGQHISRVFILAIWVQNYFLRELIFAKMKKKTDFENFIIIFLHFLFLKIVNS